MEDGMTQEDVSHLVLSEDLDLLNTAALECGREAAKAHLEAEKMELARKKLQLDMRDDFVRRGSNKTTAEDQVRTAPEYVVYVAKIEGLRAIAEEFRAFSRYFDNRVHILLVGREVTA